MAISSAYYTLISPWASFTPVFIPFLVRGNARTVGYRQVVKKKKRPHVVDQRTKSFFTSWVSSSRRNKKKTSIVCVCVCYGCYSLLYQHYAIQTFVCSLCFSSQLRYMDATQLQFYDHSIIDFHLLYLYFSFQICHVWALSIFRLLSVCLFFLLHIEMSISFLFYLVCVCVCSRSLSHSFSALIFCVCLSLYATSSV